MRKTNAYNNAKLCRMVVEDVMNENGIDLFVFGDLEKTDVENIKLIHPDVLASVTKYIWNGTTKLTREVKQAISFFAFEEIVNKDSLTFLLPPDGKVITDQEDVEYIETETNWNMLFDTCNHDEIWKAIAYVWGTAGLDYFKCSDEIDVGEFENDRYEVVTGNPFADSGQRRMVKMWGGRYSFDSPTTSSLVPSDCY